MRKKSWLSSVLFTGLLLAPCALHAQQDTATLTGDVRDETGAGVPQASVVVTSVATNIPLRTETSARGSYTLPGLKPGPYQVTVEKQGFQKTVRSGITLQVNQVARVDFTLKLGSIESVVEVIGAAPLLETETSSRGAVIDQKKIVELPLNGRDYNQLALLSPGVLAGTP